jgi:cobaltochelatase CobT
MTTTTPPAAAFMSYAHADDYNEYLTVFRELLGKEVRVQLGRDFLIFQDTQDIKLGQDWANRITTSVNDAAFFIPIITPSFFNSPYCRNELSLFLRREKKLKRRDLVLPVYYVKSDLMEDAASRAGDKLAQEIKARQYADWRELRFETPNSATVMRKLAAIADNICQTLKQLSAPPASGGGKRSAPAKKTARPPKPARPRASHQPPSMGSPPAS